MQRIWLSFSGRISHPTSSLIILMAYSAQMVEVVPPTSVAFDQLKLELRSAIERAF